MALVTVTHNEGFGSAYLVRAVGWEHDYDRGQIAQYVAERIADRVAELRNDVGTQVGECYVSNGEMFHIDVSGGDDNVYFIDVTSMGEQEGDDMESTGEYWVVRPTNPLVDLDRELIGRVRAGLDTAGVIE